MGERSFIEGADYRRRAAARGRVFCRRRRGVRCAQISGGFAMFDLQNKVAVITGGNGGIGFGMAQGLATAGARVVIAARNIAKSAAAVDLLKSSGAQALAIEVD